MQTSSASSSIQAPSDQAISSSVFSAASERTDPEADGTSALEALTDFPDAPFERIDLPRVSDVPADEATHAFVDEEERAELDRPPPEWCVDLGSSMLAMTTFELWMALARGDVDGKTSVWRNGMDNWGIVAEIPELAYALADSLSLAPPPVIPTPTEVISVRGHDRTPLGFGTTDAANDGHDDRPAESSPFSRRGKVFSVGSGRAAFAAACFAAAAALGLAVVPRSSEAPDAAVGAHRPLAVARLHGAMERANRQVAEAVQRRVETEAARAVAPVSSSARQHKEVGQRRTRRRGKH